MRKFKEEPQDSYVLAGGQTGHLLNKYRAWMISDFNGVVRSSLFWDIT
jgi:hypothetical protein